jgi:bifunctional DNA-binding transcriptional regulator/antitoxin component of YhaV-PrlF toxin-antitoxin module|tara:strand:+ start:229 stop:390 length:162 start_codon:yes stop_codon:yes gene_type:complete
MAKISYTGKQYTLTIPKDLMKMMGWNKDTEIFIGKYPEKNIIYIEKIKDENKK